MIVVAIVSNTCEKRGRDIAVLSQAASDSANVIKRYKASTGELMHQIRTYEITVAQLKEYDEQLGVDNKKLKKQIESLNNLVGYWRGKAGIRDSVVVANTDTVYLEHGESTVGKAFSWGNKFITISGISDSDSTSLVYSYAVDFSLTAYRQRSGFLNLKRGNLVTDIYFSDPNFQVKEFKGYVIKEPPKKWWETGAFKFAVGFASGVFASKI